MAARGGSGRSSGGARKGSSASKAGPAKASAARSAAAKKSAIPRLIVSADPSGGYRVDRPGAARASAKAPTKAAAEKRAKEIMKRSGGGEVTTRRKDGTFADSDTVKPGNDPYPPKDKRH